MKRLILVLILLPQILFAQIFTNKKSNTSFLDLQQEFNNYRTSVDINNVKGWKWFKRWEHHYDQRLNPDGTLSDLKEYVNTLSKMNLQNNASSKMSSAWVPFGPNELPPSFGPSSHGMGRINCVTFHPTDSNIMYVGVAQGGIWKTTNAGQTFTPIGDNLPIIRISDIAIDPNNTNTLYASVGDYAYLGVALNTDGRKRHTHYGIGIYKSIDGGNTWAATGLTFEQNNFDASLIRRVIVKPNNSNELIAVGIEGIWKSYDAGQTWTKKSNEIIWDLEENPKNPNTLYASTGYVYTLNEGSAGLMKSTNFGETWTTLNTNIPSKNVQRVEIAVSLNDTNYVYAITCGLDRGFEGFYASTNGGQSWVKRYSTSNDINLLGWYNSSDPGGQGTYDLAIVVDAKDKNKVYVGGINMWGTTDGGLSWNGVSFWLPYYGEKFLHADQHQYKYNATNDAYFVANDGGLYRSDSIIIGTWNSPDPNYEFPTRWKFVSNGMQITSFYRLGLREQFGDVIAGAQDNSTFYKEGNSWVNIIGGDGMECALHPSDALTLYGSYQFGNFVQSFDGGLSYNSLFQPGDEAGEWTTPFKISKNSADILYLGYGNIYKSTDEGISFQKKSNFATMSNGQHAPISFFDVANSNEDYIYVAKRIVHKQNEKTKLYVTTNGGTSWINATAGLPDSLYITYISVDNENPSTAWVVFSGFVDGQKVYKTTNAGQSWTNISYNLPNIPVNTIVNQAGSNNNIIYIGTDNGVYYTHDGITTWERYSNLMPNVIVSELEIHADSNKLFAATFGRGIWMTDLVSNTVGINQNKIDYAKIKLFPNTNKGTFKIEIENLESTEIEISIIDVQGRKIFNEKLEVKNSNINKEYNLNLNSGIYYYRIKSNEYTKAVSFIVE